MKKLKAVLIGAGNRGTTYTNIMARMKDKYEVISVAEPIVSRREKIKNTHNIKEEMCFDDWHPLFELGKIADVAIIATMDMQHYEPAMAAIELGYDILLEKPVSPDAKECYEIARKASEKGVKIIVCHVLRYTALFCTLKDIIDSGKIGKVMSVVHEECVGNVHQSHSFVRGNWGNTKRGSCMLLQKSCHDIDILQWLLGSECKKVQSFGTLSHFTRENAPPDAPEYCIDGCPHRDTCPYNAVKLYLDDKKNDWFRTTSTREAEPTDEMVEKALRSTQYGKCVYKCDNDVVDHQTVNMLFDNDVTVMFSMNAFNKGGRFIHIMGTKGEVHACTEDDSPITVFDFETRRTTEIPMSGADGITGGHGGGDIGIISTLYEYLNDAYEGKSVSTINESCNNHLIVFAAEKSRETGTVINFDEYLKDFE